MATDINADGWFAACRRARHAAEERAWETPTATALVDCPHWSDTGGGFAEGKVFVHGKSCGSWACVRCGHGLSRRLEARLEERCRDERAVMVTLTIARDRFSCAKEAFAFCKRNKSVARSIKAFCDAHGIAFQGQWLSKLELQNDGWPHWHVLLLVPWGLQLQRRGAFDDFWDLGFSNVRLRASVRYVAKYVSKSLHDVGSALRLSGLQAKGVRWITASRGFWSMGRKPREIPLELDRRIKWPQPLDERVAACRMASRVSVVLRNIGKVSVVLPWAPHIVHACLAVAGGQYAEGDGGAFVYRAGLVSDAIREMGVDPEDLLYGSERECAVCV